MCGSFFLALSLSLSLNALVRETENRERERERESLFIRYTPLACTHALASCTLVPDKITLAHSLSHITKDIPAKKEGPFSFDLEITSRGAERSRSGLFKQKL